jgi:pimeloyl-ACP methyl ester carboxylesterase
VTAPAAISDAGHAPQIQEPDRFNEALIKALGANSR